VGDEVNWKAGKNLTKKKIVIMGETYNVDSSKGSFAITSGEAHAPTAQEEALEELGSPQLVKHLMDEPLRPPTGPLETVEEIPTIHDYYAGDLHLNVINVKCDIYTNKTDCIHNSSCGWCGSSNGCILGTNFGPAQPCVRASYIYGRPYPNFHPQVKMINENVGGVTQTIVSKLS